MCSGGGAINCIIISSTFVFLFYQFSWLQLNLQAPYHMVIWEYLHTYHPASITHIHLISIYFGFLNQQPSDHLFATHFIPSSLTNSYLFLHPYHNESNQNAHPTINTQMCMCPIIGKSVLRIYTLCLFICKCTTQ